VISGWEGGLSGLVLQDTLLAAQRPAQLPTACSRAPSSPRRVAVGPLPEALALDRASPALRRSPKAATGAATSRPTSPTLSPRRGAAGAASTGTHDRRRSKRSTRSICAAPEFCGNHGWRMPENTAS